MRWLTQASMVIGACVSTGLVARLASGPSAAHPAVWPPVGVALAALLVCGRRQWPAVAVAAVLLALVALRQSPGLSWPEVLAGAAVLGALYTVQALAGRWLVHRTAGAEPQLLHTRHVLAFLFVAGPLHTVFASAVGAAVYCQLGVVAWADWPGAWLRWWGGDAAGGLAFAPAALALVGRPRAVWRPRVATVGVPLALAAGLVGFAVASARGRDEDHARQRVVADADRAAAVVGENFAILVGGLEVVRDVYPAEALTRPPARGFIRHELRAVRRSVGAVTTASIDLIVPAGRREAFERAARQDAREPLADFRLFEHGPGGEAVPAAPRDRHVVVYHVDPPDRAALGFDAASDPVRAEAYCRAAETGRPAVAWSGGRILVVVPIPERPGAEVRGFATAAIDADAWLVGLRSEAGPRLALLPPGAEPDAAPAGGAVVTRPVALAGGPWRIAAVASSDYLAEHRTQSADWAAAGGLAGLAVLAALLLRLTGQAAARAAERDREATARRKSEARLAEAQKVAGVGYWEWDPVAGQGYWSPELSAILNEPVGPEPAAANLLACVHPEDRPQFEDALHDQLADRTPVEIRVVRADGEVRWVAATLSRDPDDPGSVVRGTARDVTDRKLFEANLQKSQRLESVGVLAGGVAHDFNNLLTGILGNASLARDQLPAGSDLHEYLRPIEKSAEHAAQLTQQLLGYAGRGGARRGAVDVNRLIEEAADLVRLSASRKAALRTELTANLPPVEADPGQLRQVLLNLVQNASEALGVKGGTITVRTGGMSEPEARADGHWAGEPPAGPHVWIEVADTGYGMDGPTLAKVFDPFFSTKFTGRGLGLAAVRGIVAEHRGAVRVTSEPGQGTAFRVYLPAAAPRSVGVDEPTPWPVRGTAPPGRTALVVDDESAVRKLAGIALRSLGFVVAEAAGGPEAVEQFRADPGRFALVLLDLSLAGSDGEDVLSELRRGRPELPVVLMSGYPEPTGLLFGPTLQFLQKPFRPVDLKGIVRRAVGSTPG
ncbi:MAG TPA: ATP-binding protein [Fimbriiglobus sp.]|nr:ATP-binding protein [Fimbriiglobus sp.]